MEPHAAENSPSGRAETIRRRIPPGGLFHEKTWRVTPDPFPVSPALVDRLERLGIHLARFNRACAQLYRMSVDGRQPGWIAALLDSGKPPELVAAQRAKPLANAVARVIRPDLVLDGDRFVIAEIDSVPGGIGLTAWLAETYAEFADGILGGPDGMIEGFASIFRGGDILVSEEASTYRPEMEWLAGRIAQRFPESSWNVRPAETAETAGPVYRFFEMFDLANIPGSTDLVRRAADGTLEMTPPPKPALEEKLWFALFWLRPLRGFWERALGGKTCAFLRECLPYTWLLDPSALPPHAVIPQLGIHSWTEAANFSQKERHLILKVSGFSDRAWGSRGVVLGSDISGPAWAEALEAALNAWPDSPHILQQFHPGGLVEHPWHDEASGHIVTMRGRVRLCPYYFVPDDSHIRLGGALATLCPDDKKLLHGMTDAILAPAALASEI